MYTPGEYPKRTPIGMYDRSILCRECDNVFSPWENHAQQILLHDFSGATPVHAGTTKIAWTIDRFDYRLLRLFFISLLWRASISTHQFFGRVSIGPFEEQLKKMIKNVDPGTPETFAVVISKFDDPGLTAMLDPHLERYESVNYCRFYLGGFVVYIKVDRRPPPELLSDLIVRDGRPIVVVLRNAADSKDIAVMKDLARRVSRLKAEHRPPAASLSRGPESA